VLNLTDFYWSHLPRSNRVHRFVSLDRPPGSGSLGGSGRLTSLAFGCAHNNAILSWHQPISVTLSGTSQLLKSGRDSENLCPRTLPRGQRRGREERRLQGSTVTIATCAELRLSGCPRDARSVAPPRLLLLTLHLVPDERGLSRRTIPSGAFRHQFSAPNQFQSRPIEDADTGQRQEAQSPCAVLRGQGRKFRELLPPLKSAPAYVSNSIRIFGRENPREGIWDVTCRLARQIVASAGSRRWDSAAQGGRFSRNFGSRHCGIISGPLLSGCSWRAFHDVAFYCCDLSPARMCQGRQGRTAREGFTRDREEHLRRPTHGPLRNCNVSGADGRPRGIRFRPNRFGRSFGRKFGVLYDDYVKNRFVNGCAINKKDQEVVLHTQEAWVRVPTRPPLESMRYGHSG
jgi:hypothetical protein